jgi:hypothetical protein
MSYLVYLLCAITSFVCTLLLFRNVRKARSELIMWSALCFLCFTLANVLLFIDLALVPQIDFSAWRAGMMLIGASMLLFGLIRSHT